MASWTDKDIKKYHSGIDDPMTNLKHHLFQSKDSSYACWIEIAELILILCRVSFASSNSTWSVIRCCGYHLLIYFMILLYTCLVEWAHLVMFFCHVDMYMICTVGIFPARRDFRCPSQGSMLSACFRFGVSWQTWQTGPTCWNDYGPEFNHVVVNHVASAASDTLWFHQTWQDRKSQCSMGNPHFEWRC